MICLGLRVEDYGIAKGQTLQVAGSHNVRGKKSSKTAILGKEWHIFAGILCDAEPTNIAVQKLCFTLSQSAPL